MAARRAISLAPRCSACQSHVLSSFISSIHPLSGANILGTQAPPQKAVQRRSVYSAQSRRLSTASSSKDRFGQEENNPRLLQEEQERLLTDDTRPWYLQEPRASSTTRASDDIVEEKGTNLEAALEDQEAPSAEDTRPWYLQGQEAEPETVNPFAARQQLPDLPPNAPPILEPMLKHISVDLGLDYVSILDLRLLDPPPALGSGTIMIFGSVRSFKHLNVSADRLCRWLRTEYKLTPNADGLLGRNELKLKMRRRARRSRMLGAAGVRETPDFDDGITTNWICVDVGEVEDGPDAKDTRGAQNKGFVGFGKEINTAKVVVQLMTEEKRTEMDLEGMWQALLEREERKKEGERRAWAKLDEAETTTPAVRTGMDATLQASRAPTIGSQISPTSFRRHSAQQVRSIHTSTRRRNADQSKDPSTKHMSDREMDAILEPLRRHNARAPQQTFSSLMPDAMPSNGKASSDAMRKQLNSLQIQNVAEAIKQLGEGQDDRRSTEFLWQFHSAWPPFPQTEHFLCLLDLQCYALLLGHQRYKRLRLMEIFRDMQRSSLWIPKEAFIMGLEAILLSSHQPDNGVTSQTATELDRLNAMRRSLGFAFELIERMEAHGYDVRTAEVFVLLLDAISNPPTAFGVPTDDQVSADRSTSFLDEDDTEKLQHRFRRALDLLHKPTTEPDDPIYLALMETCILTNQWNQFWQAWQHVARLGKPRGTKMYTMLFSGVARTQDQAKCQRALMTNVAEMSKERPVVRMEGEVSQAVLECLVSADINEEDGQWREIAASCRAGLDLA